MARRIRNAVRSRPPGPVRNVGYEAFFRSGPAAARATPLQRGDLRRQTRGAGCAKTGHRLVRCPGPANQLRQAARASRPGSADTARADDAMLRAPGRTPGSSPHRADPPERPEASAGRLQPPVAADAFRLGQPLVTGTSLGARLRTRGGPCIRCDHLKWVRAQCSIQATSQPGANRPADWHASSASVAPGSAAARLQCRNQRRRTARNTTVNRCHATQSTSPRRGRPVGGSFRKPRTVTSGFELTLALPRGRQRGRRFEESSPFEMEEPERRCQHVPLPEFGPLLAD